MIYENNLEGEIIRLMQSCGTLDIKQIHRYFSPAVTSDQEVTNALSSLIHRRILTKDVIDTDTTLLHFTRSLELKKNVRTHAIESFWVIANLGCYKVESVMASAYPIMYSFLLSQQGERSFCDVSYIRDEQEAFFATRVIQNGLPLQGEDETTHIIVVPKKEVAEKIKRFSFDMWVCYEKSEGDHQETFKYFDEFEKEDEKEEDEEDETKLLIEGLSV